MKTVGWIGALTFPVTRRDLLLVGLNVTSHSLVHLTFVPRSMFSNCAVTSGCSTIRYKLVLSAKSRIFACISFTISLLKSKNNNGTYLESWGTHAFMKVHKDSTPGSTTLCLRLKR